MQITFHADSNTDGGQLMAEHVTTVVMNALGRFGERITSVALIGNQMAIRWTTQSAAA